MALQKHRIQTNIYIYIYISDDFCFWNLWTDFPQKNHHESIIEEWYII